MPKKRILIIGNGSIGKKHQTITTQNSRVGEVTRIGQREFDFMFKSLVAEEADGLIRKIAGGMPDISIVAGPANKHIETASILLDMGIHTLIEKPLSNSTVGISDFLSRVNQKKLCVSIGYNLRFSPSLQYFKSMVQSGKVGKIYSIRSEVGQFLPDWRPELDYKKSVTANASMGGGVILELSHEIDYLQWIFGPIDKVFGSSNTVSELGVDVEDTAYIVCSFLDKKYGEQLKASINMDFVRRDPTRICFVIGELGTLKWNGISNEVLLYEAGNHSWENLFNCESPKNESYIRALDNFIDCVDNNSKPAATIKDGGSVLNVIDAIRKSSIDNCFVSIDKSL